MKKVIALSKGWEFECPECGCLMEVEDVSLYGQMEKCENPECEIEFKVEMG